MTYLINWNWIIPMKLKIADSFFNTLIFYTNVI
jgi:hypothetical protein